jgi:plastocyanin
MNRSFVVNMISLSALLMFMFFSPTALSAENIGTPKIVIKDPVEGSEVAPGNVTISVEIMNFLLADKFGQKNVPGEGHIHYYMDAVVPTEPGKPAISAPGTYAPSPNTSHTWDDVAPGRHNLSVQLVNNDHTPLDPPVVSTVNITVPPVTKEAVVDLIARGVAFNTKSITVQAGAMVTVNFDNQDSGIRHNFAVYDSPAAEIVIFKGDLITGPSKITYTFQAPDKPGIYFFRCDPHAKIMNGQFKVQYEGQGRRR